MLIFCRASCCGVSSYNLRNAALPRSRFLAYVSSFVFVCLPTSFFLVIYCRPPDALPGRRGDSLISSLLWVTCLSWARIHRKGNNFLRNPGILSCFSMVLFVEHRDTETQRPMPLHIYATCFLNAGGKKKKGNTHARIHIIYTPNTAVRIFLLYLHHQNK